MELETVVFFRVFFFYAPDSFLSLNACYALVWLISVCVSDFVSDIVCTSTFFVKLFRNMRFIDLTLPIKIYGI